MRSVQVAAAAPKALIGQGLVNFVGDDGPRVKE